MSVEKLTMVKAFLASELGASDAVDLYCSGLDEEQLDKIIEVAKIGTRATSKYDGFGIEFVQMVQRLQEDGMDILEDIQTLSQ